MRRVALRRQPPELQRNTYSPRSGSRRGRQHHLLAPFVLCSIVLASQQEVRAGSTSCSNGAALPHVIVTAVATAATGASARSLSSWTASADQVHAENGPRQKEYQPLSARDMSDWLVDSPKAIMTVDVDVVLVGFHGTDVKRATGGGDGGGGSNSVYVDEAILELHFDALVEGMSPDEKGGMPITLVDQRYENELSRLGVRQKLLFHVEHANPHVDRPLVRRITEAVESEIQAATSTGAKDQVVGIPRTEVDKAIHSHYDERKKTTTLYTLYLVHPGVRSRYRYIHDTSASAAVPPGDKGSAAKPTLPDGCSYVGWVGEHDRYVWLDLGAHVSSGWGPRSRSSGIVSPFTFPDMSTAATSSWKAESYGWLYSQLSALALRTATQLMAPPVVFAPAGLRENFQPWSPRSSTNSWATYDTEEHGSEAREAVAVKLFMVCDPAPCAQEEIHMWGELEELLQNVGARSDASMFFPTVTLSVAEVNLMQWPLLAVGLQQAVRTGPRRPTLASHELRHWLRQFIDTKAIQNEEDRREGTEFAGNRDHRSDGRSSTRTIPLFVINVDTDTPILLEHSMRSTVFPDMVISVSATGTGTSPVDSGFQCAGHNVSFPGHADGGSRSLLRETVASLAQAIYGAPPRTLSWNTLTDSLGTDYLWATGASLHTPLSSHASLTFPERDAYVRTRVLAKVDAAIRAARVVLEQAAAVEPVLANALSAGDNAVAVRHWTGVKRELENCLQELVMHHEKSAIDHALKFEAHVGGLGRALSRGYGSGVHVSSCSCGQADGGGGFGGVGGEVRWRVFGISKGFTDALFAAAAFCAALAMLCKCARRPKTKRS